MQPSNKHHTSLISAAPSTWGMGGGVGGWGGVVGGGGLLEEIQNFIKIGDKDVNIQAIQAECSLQSSTWFSSVATRMVIAVWSQIFV